MKKKCRNEGSSENEGDGGATGSVPPVRTGNETVLLSVGKLLWLFFGSFNVSRSILILPPTRREIWSRRGYMTITMLWGGERKRFRQREWLLMLNELARMYEMFSKSVFFFYWLLIYNETSCSIEIYISQDQENKEAGNGAIQFIFSLSHENCITDKVCL